MDHRDRFYKARAHLQEINRLIYAKGAPLGSHEYFKIREISAKYEREAQSEQSTDD